MSKRKTYGEIAYNADCASYGDPIFSCTSWNDLPSSRRNAYERAAKAVLSAYNRRFMYDHECEQMTNGTLKRQYKLNKRMGMVAK